jgi:hypothetical protein
MMQNLKPGERFTGQQGLIQRLRLHVPPPYVVSIVGAAAQVEYLADVILKTVRVDLRQELEYLARFDRIYPLIDERLDGVPRNKVTLLISLCLQDNGRLAKGKRRKFPMLSDEDIADVERLIAEAESDDLSEDQA